MQCGGKIKPHFDVFPSEISHFARENACIVNGTWRESFRSYDSMRQSDAMIVFSKGRGLMYDPRSIIRGDIGVIQDFECGVAILQDGQNTCNQHSQERIHLGDKIIKQRRVAHSFQLCAFVLPQFCELGFLRILVESSEPSFMEDEVLVLLLIVDFDVDEIRVNTKSKIGGQCPRCSRPCEERSLGIIYQGKRNSDYVLISG